MDAQKLQLIFFLIILIIISVISFFIFFPFFNVLAIAAVLATVFQPLYRQVLRKVGNREALAAAILVIVVAIVFLAILAFVGSNIFIESRNLYFNMIAGETNYLDTVVSSIEDPIRKFFPNVTIDIKSYADDVVGLIGSYAGTLLTGTAVTIFNLFLAIIAFYYFLKDGEKFKKAIINLSPLKDEIDQHIFNRLEISVNTVVRGTLLVALIQGFLAGIGMLIFGVPNATLWGTLAVVAAIVPGLGTAIVIVPAVIYLLVTGVTAQAIGLAIWGVIMVGLIDNFLTPFLYSRGTNIHPLIILFSVLGGLALFGPVGFLFGPLVVSLLYVLMHVYRILVLKNETEETLI